MSFDDDFDLDEDILQAQRIRSSMENCQVSITSARDSMSNQHQAHRQANNITECLVNQVFANQEMFEPRTNEPERTLPYVHHPELLPNIMQNTLYYRFKSNMLLQKPIRCDIQHFEFEIMHADHACTAPVQNERYIVEMQQTYRKRRRYSVRVVRYEKNITKKRALSQYEIQNGAISPDANETITVRPHDDPVLILHDFHQHPLLLKQLVSELDSRTVIIPSMHDLLRIAYMINSQQPLAAAVDILEKMFADIAKMAIIGHGVGCIVAQLYCNRRSYGQIIMCNPPPRFRYIFEKEQIIKISRMVEVNSSFTAPSDVQNIQECPQSPQECPQNSPNHQNTHEYHQIPKPQPPPMREEDSYKEEIKCNTVLKQFCITPNGNRQHVCGDYDYHIEEQCRRIQQEQQIQADYDYLDVCNDFLFTEYQYLGQKFKQLRVHPQFHSQMNLEKTIMQTTKAKFKNLLLNLLIFAPLPSVFNIFEGAPLFDQEFFDTMPIFAQLLCDEMPVIPRDTREKYIIFGSNYSFAEVQTLNFFKQVDKNDGDVYCKTIVGCGYDMFQCIPQVISNLVFNVTK